MLLRTLGDLFWRTIMMRIRLMPVVIFCACLILSAKVTTVWTNVRTTQITLEPTRIHAEEPAKPSGDKKEAAAVPAPEAKKEAASKTNFAQFDPLTMSNEEYATLQTLSKRRQEIETKKQEDPAAVATSQAVEAKIAERTQRLQEAEKRLAEMMGKIEQTENANTARLVKIAENMKPKEAAKILEGVEFDVLVELMARIKEGKASAILSNMEPQKASFLMTELAVRKKVTSKKEAAAPAN